MENEAKLKNAIIVHYCSCTIVKIESDYLVQGSYEEHPFSELEDDSIKVVAT
jgi:hypothetical protein